MTYLLHTERLNLRPSQLSDLDILHQLWGEADVRKFLFDDRQISLQEARSFIEASAVSFANYGYGIWLFSDQQSNLVAGFSGLLHAAKEPPGLIFGTQPQLSGRGYAREATLSIFHYAFDVVGLERVVADVDEPNEASIKTLEALGMLKNCRVVINERPLLFYEIQTWHRR